MKLRKEDHAIYFLGGQYVTLDQIINIGNNSFVELDAGCGKGSFTTAIAKQHPERLFLAADVMIGRLRKLQKRNQREHVENIIPLRVELRYLIACLIPDRTLDRIHLLCPDPWPKDRHRGNRLLCSNFIAQLYRVLKPGGHFHFSSDDPAYLGAVQRVFAASGLFETCPDLLGNLPEIKSDFELLWNRLERPVQHLLLVKNS